jgi:acid phosphatase family membrane protein YuiD
MVGITSGIGLQYGVQSPHFALAFSISLIILYDALNVRYQAGLHAKALNSILSDTDKRFNESIGHTPLEAFFGGIV